MRKLWLPLVLGTLIVSSFTSTVETIPKIEATDDLFKDLEEYRVKHPHDVSQVLETFTAALEVVNLTWSAIKVLFSSK
jgi:hypothetical protein